MKIYTHETYLRTPVSIFTITNSNIILNSSISQGKFPTPKLKQNSDRYIPGIQKLVERISDESGGQTKVLIQLIDFLAIRRRPQREKFLKHHLVITSRIRDRLNLPLAEEKEIRKNW